MVIAWRVYCYSLGIFWAALLVIAGLGWVLCFVLAPLFNRVVDRLARMEKYEPADIGEAPPVERQVVYRDCDGCDDCVAAVDVARWELQIRPDLEAWEAELRTGGAA